MGELRMRKVPKSPLPGSLHSPIWQFGISCRRSSASIDSTTFRSRSVTAATSVITHSHARLDHGAELIARDRFLLAGTKILHGKEASTEFFFPRDQCVLGAKFAGGLKRFF